MPNSSTRQPIQLIKAKGKSHFSYEEIKKREEEEVQPLSGSIEAPDHLTKKQKEEFYKNADMLKRLKIMGESDVEALARYVVANESFIKTTRKLRGKEANSDIDVYIKLARLQEKYFNMTRAAANDLGLSISSRCKLVVPGKSEEKPKENKFAKFEKVSND